MVGSRSQSKFLLITSKGCLPCAVAQPQTATWTLTVAPFPSTLQAATFQLGPKMEAYTMQTLCCANQDCHLFHCMFCLSFVICISPCVMYLSVFTCSYIYYVTTLPGWLSTFYFCYISSLLTMYLMLRLTQPGLS